MNPAANPTRIAAQPRFSQSGFTLVEIMVGLAIGLLATLIVMQVFSVFEKQKQVTTGSADAQTGGAIALYNITKELQLAGFPIMPTSETLSPFECTTLMVDGVAQSANGLGAVTIIDGSAASAVNSTDTITIRYGDTPLGGIPTTINTVGSPNPTDVSVPNNFGCTAGDRALISLGTSCALTTVSGVSAASPVPMTITLDNIDAGITIAGASLSCLGDWSEISFSAQNGALVRNVDGVDTVLMDGIVNIQAQYGVSAATNDNNITNWCDATDTACAGATWDPASITVANRNRIKAIRFAVVARNAKMDGAVVTNDCSGYTTESPSGLCAWAGSTSSPAPAITLSGDPDWNRYRYRVFETVIPLRNVIWSKEAL